MKQDEARGKWGKLGKQGEGQWQAGSGDAAIAVDGAWSTLWHF